MSAQPERLQRGVYHPLPYRASTGHELAAGIAADGRRVFEVEVPPTMDADMAVNLLCDVLDFLDPIEPAPAAD